MYHLPVSQFRPFRFMTHHVNWCPTRFPYQLMFRLVQKKHDRCHQWCRNCYSSGAHELTSCICAVCAAKSLAFCVVFCRSLFVHFFWSLQCMSFLDLWFLITSLFGIYKTSQNKMKEQAISIRIYFYCVSGNSQNNYQYFSDFDSICSL